MIINSKNIELFKNLSQFDFDNVYYDFHNDFDCIKITLENNTLTLLFKKNFERDIISFEFKNVNITRFEFSKFVELKTLTIDNLYRGRFDENGFLREFNKDGKSYFYLDFCDGAKMELWSDSIECSSSVALPL